VDGEVVGELAKRVQVLVNRTRRSRGPRSGEEMVGRGAGRSGEERRGEERRGEARRGEESRGEQRRAEERRRSLVYDRTPSRSRGKRRELASARVVESRALAPVHPSTPRAPRAPARIRYTEIRAL